MCFLYSLFVFTFKTILVYFLCIYLIYIYTHHIPNKSNRKVIGLPHVLYGWMMHQAHHPELLQRSCRFAIQLIEGNGPCTVNSQPNENSTGQPGAWGGQGGAWGEVDKLDTFFLVEIWGGLNMVGCLIIWGG